MIDKKSVKKMAKKVFQQSNGIRKPKMVHPTRDWEIGLLVAIVIFSTTAIWSVHTYDSYRDVSDSERTSINDQGTVYRETVVKKALEEFEKKRLIHESLFVSLESEIPETEITKEMSPATTTPSTTGEVTDTDEEGETSTSTTEADIILEEPPATATIIIAE